MQTLADVLAALGHHSLAAFWLPLGMWTLLALPTGLLLHYGRWIPAPLRYYGAMALLFALPLGLLLGLATSWQSPFSTLFSTAPPAAVTVEPFTATPLAATPLALHGYHLIGALVLSLLLAGAVRLGQYSRELGRLTRLHRTLLAHPATPLPELETLRHGYGIRPAVHVVALSTQAVPMTFGWRRPVLVLPTALLDDPAALRMSLLHELVHIRQRDFVLRVLEGAVEALFGLHPLVSGLARTSARFRELVCDAEVLTRPDVPRRAYAALLLAFAERPNPTPALALCMAVPSTLQQRIRAMNQPIPSALRQRHLRHASLGAAALLLLAGSLFTACTEPAPPEATAATERPAASVLSEQRADATPAPTPAATPALQEQPAPVAPKKAAKLPPPPPPPLRNEVPAEMPPPLLPPKAPEAQQAAASEVDTYPKALNMEVIGQNLRYPEAAHAAKVEGRVVISFVVDETGQVTRPSVLQGIGHGCDEEALRVVQLLRFEPGQKDGKVVPTKLALPINFKLE
jgi:TonB family protein